MDEMTSSTMNESLDIASDHNDEDTNPSPLEDGECPPPSLSDYISTSTLMGKAGLRTNVIVMRFPNESEPETQKEKVALWLHWWKETSYGKKEATDSKFCKMIWNSAKRTSPDWLNFGEAAHQMTGRPYVYCLKCSLLLVHPTPGRNGTTSLKRHQLSRHCTSRSSTQHSPRKTQAMVAIRQLQMASIIRPVLEPTPIFNPEILIDEVVNVFTACDWPFRTAEREAFKRFVAFLRPDAILPNRKRLAQAIQIRAREIRGSLLSDLGVGTKVSIALDVWDSKNHISFLAVQAYYITDHWQYRERLLDMVPLYGNHTGATLALALLDVLKCYGIQDRILAVVADNASNNNTLRQALTTYLRSSGIQWDCEENSISCLAHVINLVVGAMLSKLKLTALNDEPVTQLSEEHIQVSQDISVPNTLRKLRAICVAVNSSTVRFENFKRLQSRITGKRTLTLIQDVRTRWNSTYDMIRRALRLQKFINTWIELYGTAEKGKSRIKVAHTDKQFYGRELGRLFLSPREWGHLRELMKLLKVFKSATDDLSRAQEPNIQYIWDIFNSLFDNMEAFGDNDSLINGPTDAWTATLHSAVSAGQEKLKRYYEKTDAKGGRLFNCGTVLDPSRKLKTYEGSAWEPTWKPVYREQFCNYFLVNYRTQIQTDTTSAAQAVSSAPVKKKRRWFSRGIQERSSSPGPCSLLTNTECSEEVRDIQTEANAYLDAAPCAIEEDSGVEVLSWWRRNRYAFPHLARMAKDVLAIPIATVGVERVFNVTRDIVQYRRGNLHGSTIRDLVIIKEARKILTPTRDQSYYQSDDESSMSEGDDDGVDDTAVQFNQTLSNDLDEESDQFNSYDILEDEGEVEDWRDDVTVISQVTKQVQVRQSQSASTERQRLRTQLHRQPIQRGKPSSLRNYVLTPEPSSSQPNPSTKRPHNDHDDDDDDLPMLPTRRSLARRSLWGNKSHAASQS